jgi:hypothetical protein
MKYLKKFEQFDLDIFGLSSKDKIEVDKKANTEMQPIKIGDNNEGVRTLQVALEALGFKLSRYGVDAKFGHETLGQTKSLLNLVEANPELKKLVDGNVSLDVSNGVVSPEVQQVIIGLSQVDAAKKAISNYYKELEAKIGSTDLIFKDLIVQKIDNPEGFIAKLYEVCQDLKINPNWLLYVMWMESKLDTQIQNRDTKATGLIQFIPSTADELGTSVDQLRRMSSVEQMEYVHKYFLRFKGKMHSAEDVYFAVFYPAAIGKSDDWVLQHQGVSAAKIAKQNKGVNQNGDNEITVDEFKDYIQKGIASTGHASQINKGIA